MQQPAAKPTMHVMRRSPSPPLNQVNTRSNDEIIADQVAAILAKRAAANDAANPDNWTAIDAARVSVKAAESSRNYLRMATDAHDEMRTMLELFGMEIKSLRRQCATLTEQNASLRNTCIGCGIASAIVGGIAWSLIGSFSSPAQPQPQPQVQIERTAG
ncbi:MAG: hypothetical protein ACRC62_14005 [Microcoleus sp.]